MTSGALRFGFRLDNAYYFASPDPTAAALTLTERRPPDARASCRHRTYFRLKEQQAGAELSNRYINWIYPAKIYLGYSKGDVDVTLGRRVRRIPDTASS